MEQNIYLEINTHIHSQFWKAMPGIHNDKILQGEKIRGARSTIISFHTIFRNQPQLFGFKHKK